MKLIEGFLWFMAGAAVMFLLRGDLANAAQWEIVSFNDAEHLAALQDSVVDICDTTYLVGEVDDWRYDEGDTLSLRAYLANQYTRSLDTTWKSVTAS